MIRTLLCCLLIAGLAEPRPQEKTRESFDDLIEAEIRKAGVEPAPLCDDGEFLRRVTLDLWGWTPSPEEVIAFSEDRDPKKREKKIDELLAGEWFAYHWAQIWNAFLLGTLDADKQVGSAWFYEYLLDAFTKNVPYDRFVRELLTAEGYVDENKAGFYVWRWDDPADLTSAASRHFLGVQIRCAQCHDHPFDSWKQKDFWGMASYFARTSREYTEEMVQDPTYGFDTNRILIGEAEEGEIDLPESKHPMKVPPRFLGEKDSRDGAHRRKLVAEWMTSPKNPWFAKATVNRVCGILLGRGFVHPVDDFQKKKKPLHEAALRSLADEFVKSKFDLRALVRTIANSRAYQRSSAWKGKRPDPGLFAVGLRRKMSRYQLFNSVSVATEFDFKFEVIPEEGAQDANPDMGGEPQMQDYTDQYFYEVQKAQSPVEKTLLQMNGSLVQDAIGAGKRMGQVFERETHEKRLEWLFLSALSRKPTAKETSLFKKYVEGAADEYQAYEDVFWTLLNSTEFVVNR